MSKPMNDGHFYGERSVEPTERYDHNGVNVTGTPVDEESDLVPIQLFRQLQQERDEARKVARDYFVDFCRRNPSLESEERAAYPWLKEE